MQLLQSLFQLQSILATQPSQEIITVRSKPPSMSRGPLTKSLPRMPEKLSACTSLQFHSFPSQRNNHKEGRRSDIMLLEGKMGMYAASIILSN
jgi:hypothetical protein